MSKINITNDFETGPVPQSERKSFLSITMVWTGFVFVVSSMMAGGGLAQGLPMKEIIWITLLGNIFLSIIATLMSIIASRTGLTFALISKYSFGIKGSRFSSLFVPIINLGWYTIQSAFYGHLIAQTFGLSEMGENIAMMSSAIIMGIFALIGMEALTILGFVAIPSIIFLSIATAIKAAGNVGGMDVIFDMVPLKPITVSTGLSIVVGTWIFSSSTCIADFMRYAKNVKQAALSATIGLVLGNSLLVICGAITAFSMNDGDLTRVLLNMGLVIPSFILMTTNIFTTNGGNLYSTGLNLSNALNKSSKKIVVVILITSALLTLTQPYKIDALFAFLGTLGNFVPPLPGIIFADFYILRKCHYGSLDNHISWNPIAWITWIISAIAAFTINIGFAPVNGLIIGATLYIVLMKAFNFYLNKQAFSGETNHAKQ